ncbi:BTAD domain-containing putative transcriptional regulator [Ilumatobacter sp.]|uniref:nSTAND1 domain-containing NTPase n=1 Tax=Ilumatobacter sp. TaxID=1967498 RepID=UPI003C4ACA52
MYVRVLGPVEVERDGEVVRVGGSQQRRLLACLVVHRGQLVSTDRLVEALWPDGLAPEGATRSMRTYLSRLRTVLPEGSLVHRSAGYQLDLDTITLDLVEFDSLLDDSGSSMPDQQVDRFDEALALWRGAPFGEFTDEWWALSESTRLIERRASAREDRAAALMAMGHHGRAIVDLEQIVSASPMREQPVRLLMQALAVTGRRSDALRAARAFRTRLAEETGLDPSHDLIDLEGVILFDDAGAARSEGRPLRGYTLHDAIGEGAHGRVYTATQPGTDRLVAIKVIRPDLADSTEYVRRFDTEARLVARLEHPHIVPLYDYWREPGGAFLVFRLLTGGTARDSVVTGGPWSMPRVARLVEEVGGALMAAHSRGVAHNDVKASNVLLDDQGAAYLTDFGIAVDALAHECGDRTDDDRKSQQLDVEGLAWLVWELLTGEHPSGIGPTSAPFVSSRHAAHVPSLIDRATAVPDGLDALLRLAGAPGAGGLTVAEFVLGWRAATGTVDGRASPITSSDRLAANSARRRAAHALTLATAAGVNPYRGLRPFDVADAAGFHGRSKAVDDLVELVTVRRLVTVVGASGSGKSSLVRAGLVPRLQAEGVVTVTTVPGDDPMGALDHALRELSSATDVDAADGLERTDALVGVAHRFGRIVVVVDQFEECWTRARSDDRDRFIDMVVDATRNDSLDVSFVLTVRADLLDAPLGHPRLGRLLGDGNYLVAPMSPAELDEAIVLPAADAGVSFGEGVVAELVAGAAHRPGSLPLLQFALTELYDRRIDGEIGRAAVESIGGVAGAIGRRAEALYLESDDTQRSAARSLFDRLVTPGDGSPDTRRRAAVGELSSDMSAAADRFVAARLLVTDRDPATREPTVEVAHEALLERWHRLAKWIDEDRRWLEQLRHLSAATRAWDGGGRHDTELYSGARLEAAIDAIDLDDRQVSGLERDFIESARAARDAEVVAARRTTRRLRRRLTATAVALVIALVAGTVAIVQRRDALDASDRSIAADRSAQIEALVGRAESLRPTQRDTAALLAVEAHRLADTPRTRSALFATFTDDERFLDARRLDGDRGTGGLVMPDGESAYLTGQDGVLRPYDLETGQLGAALPNVGDGDPFPVLVAAPDGHLAIGSRSDTRIGPTTVGVLDPATGAFAFEPVVIDGVVTSMQFLDGRLALAIGEKGSLVSIDTETGEETGSVPGVELADDDIIWTVDRLLRRPSAVATADGQVVLGSGDGSLRILQPDTLATTRTIALAPETVSRLWPLDDGTIVTSGRLGVSRVDLVTGEAMWFDTEFERCVNLTVAEEAGVLFCGDPYGRLEERDLTTGAVRRRLDAQNGNSGSLWIANDGTELVSFGNNEPVVSRWRLDRSGPITRVVAPGWTPSDFDHSGGRLLVDRGDPLSLTYQAKVVNTQDGSDVATIADQFDPDRVERDLLVPGWSGPDELVGIALTPEGGVEHGRVDVSAAAGPQTNGSDVRWQAPFEIRDNRLDTGKDRILYRYADDSLAALDTDGLEYGATIPIDGLVSWTIDRSGDRIAAGTSSGVRIFDADTGQQVGAILRDDLRGAFYTATDQFFVSSLGGQLTQYDASTLEPIRTFNGSRGLIFGVVGTADGGVIAINGGDRNVALFDVATSTQIGGPISLRPDERNIARLSLDGRWLAVGGLANENDGLRSDQVDRARGTQIWDLDPGVWESAACRLAGRNLTPDEWDSNIGELAPYRATCSDEVVKS